MKPPRQRDFALAVFAGGVAALAGALYLGVDLYFANGFLTLPLDDAYIFLHYARNFAAGHPMVYNLGDATTTGVTSYLYLLILTPLALVFRAPDTLVWGTFILNVVFYGASVFLFAKIAGRLFEGRFVYLSTLIFASTGPITFHALAGMDTGLFVLALLFALYSYLMYTEYGQGRVFAFALAALALARPEGILAAVLLVVMALVAAPPEVDGRPVPRRTPKWLVAAGLAPVPFYFLANYLAGGHVTSASFLSKSVWGPGSSPWPTRLAEVLAYGLFVVKSVLAGLDGTYLAQVLNVNIPYAAAACFAPLSLAFFLVGWGRAARKSWGNRRPSPAFAAGVLFLACTALSCIFLPFPRHFTRYLAAFYPLYVIGILVGIEGLATLIRYGRPAISHAAMFWTGAAYFLIFGLVSSAYAWLGFGMSARDIRFQHIATARYIRDHVAPGANIFTHDVGVLAYYSRHRIVDLEGLVSPGGWRERGEGAGVAASFVAGRGKPGDYFAGYLDVYPFNDVGLIAEPEFEARLISVTMAGGAVMTVAPFRAELFVRPPPPAMPGFEPEDDVDVADMLSEKAHHYRLRRRGANAFWSYATIAPREEGGVAATAPFFEAGRTVCGAEEFTVRAAPGRDLACVARCLPPYDVEVYANGKYAGKWAVSPAGGEGFVDGYFFIPGRAVTGTMRFQLKTAGGDFQTFRPAHYYFYSRRTR